RYASAGRAALAAVGPVMANHPTSFAYLLAALERSVRAPLEIALVGERDDDATRALRREVFGRVVPASVTITAPEGTGAGRSPLLEARTRVDGNATAYVCEHYAC